jgi:hypothetical protein
MGLRVAGECAPQVAHIEAAKALATGYGDVASNFFEHAGVNVASCRRLRTMRTSAHR